MIVGGGVVTTLFAAALGLTLPRLFAHRYAPTPYDDLLSKLVDRDEGCARRRGGARSPNQPSTPGPRRANCVSALNSAISPK